MLIETHTDAAGGVRHYWWCPGCAKDNSGFGLHVFDGRWHFDGDYDAPTFSPSYMSYADFPGGPKRCHSFVRSGVIEYLSDSTHRYAGESLLMVDIPADWLG